MILDLVSPEKWALRILDAVICVKKLKNSVISDIFNIEETEGPLDGDPELEEAHVK